MELRDLVVTPVLILVVLAAAYLIRPHVTDSVNRKYFFPGLLVKIFGAIALGFIYQFYYESGDTYNFHTHGSRHIWQAFMDDPLKGLKLIFGSKDDLIGVYEYASRIIFFHDKSSFFVIRVAAFLDVITFSSYSATAVLFAVLGFVGGWMLFVTFYNKYPQAHLEIALACLFIPSVFFWGSGILKDTLVLAALGVSTFLFDRLFIKLKFNFWNLVLLVLCIYSIFSLKKFVLQAYLPAIFFWVVGHRVSRVKSVMFKALIGPVVITIIIAAGVWSVIKVGEGDARYSINNLAITAKRTAYDIRYWTGRDAGSGYTLGELDGTFQSLLQLAPAAINVTLFRPYLWEIRNPLMFLSAFESFLFTLVMFYLLLKSKVKLFSALSDMNVLFCLIFSLSFAFAVGVSTFNFGTLSRYKIPLLPFFALALAIWHNYLRKSDRKVEEQASTE